MVLTLGILSFLLCFPLGPISGALAWFLGSQDVKAMRSGVMDPAGRDATEAGRILGLIGMLLVLVLVMVWFGFLLLSLAAAGAAYKG